MSDSSEISRPSIRHIKPLGPRVLVKLIRLEARSAAGLLLPEA